MVIGVLGRLGAAGEHARQHAQPGAHRSEPEELEAGERDESGGEEHHAGRQEEHAEGRGRAEHTPEAGDREAPRDDAQQREPEARRCDVVHNGAHRNGDEADNGEVHARRDDRSAEPAGGAAADVLRKDRDSQHTVGGEQEARHDGGAVEDVAGEVVERSQSREVQLPPQGVTSGQDGDDDPGGEGGHRTVAEVVGMMTDLAA